MPGSGLLAGLRQALDWLYRLTAILIQAYGAAKRIEQHGHNSAKTGDNRATEQDCSSSLQFLPCQMQIVHLPINACPTGSARALAIKWMKSDQTCRRADESIVMILILHLHLKQFGISEGCSVDIGDEQHDGLNILEQHKLSMTL